MLPGPISQNVGQRHKKLSQRFLNCAIKLPNTLYTEFVLKLKKNHFLKKEYQCIRLN